MEAVHSWWTVRGEGEATSSEHRIDVRFSPLVIHTNRNWKTAHSASTTRTNATFHVAVDGTEASSEVGLPPFKPGIYEGTAEDCRDLSIRFAYHLTFLLGTRVLASGTTSACRETLNLAQKGGDGGGVDAQKTAGLAIEPASERERILVTALRALDGCAASGRHPNAALALVETAILRCLSRAMGTPVPSLLDVCGGHQGPVRCFYTVGMAADRNLLAEDVRYGSGNTQFLKFKLDKDAEKALEVFSALEAEGLLVAGRRTVAIDANCSWDPEFAMDFLARLQKYLPHVYMIEQPFPFEMPFSEAAKVGAGWARFKDKCTECGIVVYADESMRTSADVAALRPYCHGVNIKLEKAGGYREAARAWKACKASGMGVWLGCMVGTALNCNVIVEILGLSDGSVDLDGFLLTSPGCQPCDPSFRLTEGPDGLKGCIELKIAE